MTNIDLTQPSLLLTYPQIADRLPSTRSGKKYSIATVARWATKGVRGVRLETVRLAQTPYSSVAALAAFVAALNAAPPRNPRTRSRTATAEMGVQHG